MASFDELARETLHFLIQIARINSDTGNREGISRVIDTCVPHLRETGFQVQTISGQHLLARRSGKLKPRVLIMGHMDTYRHLDGPFTEISREGNILKGHGVSDMKAGLAVVLYGLRHLHAEYELEDRHVTVLFNSDEESGSERSRQPIEEEAARHDIVLVFEGGKRIDRKTTTFVIERKGLLCAHFLFSPPDSEAGRGSGIPDQEPPGGKAGEKSFQVEFPFKDETEIDSIRGEFEHILEKTRDLHRESPSRIAVKICRPPMVPSGKTLEYAAIIEKIGKEIGHPIIPKTRPGMSDGCFTAALGVPTLDGLGPVGANWHTREEYLEIPTLKKRTELFTLFWKTLFEHKACALSESRMRKE